MKIYIPTLMRENNQRCYLNLPDDIKPLVTLVTHSGRFNLLRDSMPRGTKIIDLGFTDGIADVRQKLLERSRTNKCMIIDDLCLFKKRNSAGKLIPMRSSDFIRMFGKVEALLDTYPMVGISDDVSNWQFAGDLREIGRSYSCYGVNRKIWRQEGVRFDGMYQRNSQIKLYEDFYAILSLLTKGHKNAILYEYAFRHDHGKPGGNTVVRTNSLQRKCIEALQTEFPGLVKLVRKENPSWKAGLADKESFRWECKIFWSRAYKSGTVS